MTEGTTSPYKGLAVPLFGESNILQRVAANDILTIEGHASQSADYIVCQLYDGTEIFVVGASGNVTLAGTFGVTGTSSFATAVTWTGVPVLNATVETTMPTTGMTTGQFFLIDKANVTNIGFAADTQLCWRVTLGNN